MLFGRSLPLTVPRGSALADIRINSLNCYKNRTPRHDTCWGFLPSKGLAEFRVRRREIKWKSMLSGGGFRPDRTALAVLLLTDVAYPLRVNILLASQVWNFCPKGAKMIPQSRRSPPSVKKALAFLTDSRSRMRGIRDLALEVRQPRLPFCFADTEARTRRR